MSRMTPGAPERLVAEALAMLEAAERPIILMGRVSRNETAWAARLALAEAIRARVVTDLKVGAAEGRVIQVSLDHTLHNGWIMDHQALPPVDLFLAADPDQVAIAIMGLLKPDGATSVSPTQAALPGAPTSGPIVTPTLAAALRRTVGGRPVSLLHLPLSWDGGSWPFRHPLDFLGSDGGGGIGGGPGIAVGAALALPLLVVVANNQSFFNDEVHQERVARMRNRPIDNKWIGMRISDPDIDLAALAQAQGAQGFGPVHDAAELEGIFAAAITAVEAGAVAVVDVRVQPGYTPAMASALTRPPQ
jgi:thiamine pyrophosphate-dependent acetolactate synthase large subunit-like protein